MAYDSVRESFQRASRYALPHRGAAGLLLTVIGLNTALGLASPFLFGRMLDAIIDKTLHQVYAFLALMLIVALAQGAGRVAQTYADGKLQSSLLWDVKRDAHDRITAMTLPRREALSHGELVSKLEGDAGAVPSLILGNLMLIPSVIRIGVLLGFVFGLSVRLTLIQLSCLPLLFLVSDRFGAVLQAKEREYRAVGDRYMSFVQETIVGLKDIKLMQLEGRRQAEYRTLSSQMLAGALDIQLKGAYGALANTLIPSLTSLGVTAVAALMIVRGEMTPGQLIIFGAYAGQLAGTLQSVADIVRTRKQLLASLERLWGLLGEPVEPASFVPVIQEPSTVRGLVSLENVRFRYQSGPAVLRGVSFTLEPGVITAVIGLSGSGKTTLFNLLLRFYQAQSGTIRLDGRDIGELDLRVLRQAVAIVNQDPFFFRTTIRDNLLVAKPDARLSEMSEACELAYAAEFIGSLPCGFDTVLTDRGQSLSAGQKQRLALARAILRGSSVLLCDEVTANLDIESEKAVHESLRQLARTRTVAIVAHRPSTVRLADVVAVLHQGSIVDFGAHRDLLDRCAVYQNLIGAKEPSRAVQPR